MTDSEVLAFGKERAEELGLNIQTERMPTRAAFSFEDATFYYADDIHHLLGSAVEVFNAYSAQGRQYGEGEHTTWFSHGTHTATRSALLLGIREIQPESAESLNCEVGPAPTNPSVKRSE